MKNTAEFAKRQGRKAPKSVLDIYCVTRLWFSPCKHSDSMRVVIQPRAVLIPMVLILAMLVLILRPLASC